MVVVPPVPEDTATPEPIPTSALTKFIADNPTGPILIYTYTQQLKADGNHLVAACVLNIGDAPASNVETAFDAKSPAVITGLRIPSELSSRGATRATVRIATLSPKFMKQLEVSVGSVDIPVPEWISVTITRAYALNHPGDPAFPEKCEPEGVDAVTSDVKEVSLSVGPYRQILAKLKRFGSQLATSSSINNGELGQPSRSLCLQCVVGWIAFCLATLLLLVFVRRRRAAIANRKSVRRDGSRPARAGQTSGHAHPVQSGRSCQRCSCRSPAPTDIGLTDARVPSGNMRGSVRVGLEQIGQHAFGLAGHANHAVMS